jgi:tetratricopeptide (TPR) repeat protein
MVIKRVYDLALELNEKTLPFFPEALGKEGSAFHDAIVERIRSAFRPLGGVIQSLIVSEQLIKIAWHDGRKEKGYLSEIANSLTKGNYADGILLLEFFLSDEPENPDLLYNLGMAYSDQNNLERAIELLAKLVTNAPDHINGHVALGVALLRAGKVNEGISELETAVRQAPENLWAHRNLGAGLMRLNHYSEAADHLRRATEIDPDDQPSLFGYGQALDALEKVEEADVAYVKTIEIDEFSDIAERARQARSKLADKSFRSILPGVERMDAVMYCLSALEKYAGMPADQVQKIGFEIAILGTRGLDINDSTQKYTLQSLPGKFSGLHLLCFQYVAFKQIAPGQDIGFDLSAEYRTALSLFEKKAGGEK